jgi:hypothetical protein
MICAATHLLSNLLNSFRRKDLEDGDVNIPSPTQTTYPAYLQLGRRQGRRPKITGLLSEASKRSHEQSENISEHQPWVKGLLRTNHAMKVTLYCSYTNFLLVFVPLGVIAGGLSWNSAAAFILNVLTIFPLAALLSYSTEELSVHVGQIVGGLINATLGNAVEMVVSRRYICVTVFVSTNRR